MLFWNRFPFIRITILFAFGIFIGDKLIISLKSLYIISFCYLLVYVILSRSFKKEVFRKYNYVLSFVASLSIITLGCLLTLARRPAVDTIEQIHAHHPFEFYLVQICDLPGSTEKYQKAIGNIKLARHEEQHFDIPAKVLLYIPKNELIQFGDIMIISGSPSVFNAPLIPFEFDYRTHMHRKGIIFNHFITGSDYLVIKKSNSYNIRSTALSVRNKIIEMIHERLGDDQVKALLIALTTGKRDFFDDKTYDQFLGAGIVHILAVSGLHVGIIYMLLLFITRPLSYTRPGRWLRLLIIIFSFLFFAFMTGLSASVLRSVLMFTIMLIGISLERHTHILNSVFLSAFILLCYDPNLLFQVGFQLSYAAVIGIILFQPFIISMIKTKTLVSNWLWNLLSVSISAQLVTLPLTLYYFKQFPTYFFISNLFAIPFATIFLPGGIVLSITYFFTELNLFIASVLEIIGILFIQIIKIINHLPGSLIKPVNIRVTDVILLGCILFIFFLLISFKKPRLIKLVFIILLFMVLRNAFVYFSSSDEKSIIIYSIPDIFCFELIDGHQSMVIMDTNDKKHIDKFNYFTENFHVRKYLQNQIIPLSEIRQHLPGYQYNNDHLLVWNGQLILITHSEKYQIWVEKISKPIDITILLNDKTNRPIVYDIIIREPLIEKNVKGMKYISLKLKKNDQGRLFR